MREKGMEHGQAPSGTSVSHGFLRSRPRDLLRGSGRSRTCDHDRRHKVAVTTSSSAELPILGASLLSGEGNIPVSGARSGVGAYRCVVLSFRRSATCTGRGSNPHCSLSPRLMWASCRIKRPVLPIQFVASTFISSSSIALRAGLRRPFYLTRPSRLYGHLYVRCRC
jgi:hypothetical protein